MTTNHLRLDVFSYHVCIYEFRPLRINYLNNMCQAHIIIKIIKALYIKQ